jgi:superfamily I DNA and/or RNA helicase
MVFYTTILASSSFVKRFTNQCDIAACDEAGCATEAEVLIIWKGKPLILAGDPEQLPPPVFTDGVKDSNGMPVNAFTQQPSKPLMRRLLELNWPYIELNEQKRVPPGQFHLPNFVIYNNITTAPGITIDDDRFKLARDIEQFVNTLPSDSASPNGPTVTPSPEGLVLPLCISVKNSYCYKAVGGTSRGNTGTLHYTVDMISTLLKQFPDQLKMKDIIIMVPYIEQRRMYVKLSMTSGSPIQGIRVATGNSFHGWEECLIFYDMTAAANLGGRVGFVADRHRLAVTLTRQSQFLIVVGDEDCTVVKAEDVIDEDLDLNDDEKATVMGCTL